LLRLVMRGRSGCGLLMSASKWKGCAMDWFVSTPLFTVLCGVVLLAVIFVGQPLLFGCVLWVIDRIDRLRRRVVRGVQ